MSAGLRIRSSRKSQGLTQKDLAALAGCSQQTIVDIEGRPDPSSRYLPAIVSALGEEMSYIQNGIGSPAGGPSGDLLPCLTPFEVAVGVLDGLDAAPQNDPRYSSPVPVSRLAFTMLVDTTMCSMGFDVSVGDVVFADPAAAVVSGSLVVCVAPGWNRAELRVVSEIRGQTYLSLDNFQDRFGCTIYRAASDYLSSDREDALLVAGVVVFMGRSALL